MWVCEKCQHDNESSDETCWSCGASQAVPESSESAQLEASQPCMNCGSTKVIPNVRVLDRDGDFHDSSLSVRIDRNPNAVLMKGSEVCHLKAWICGSCGFTQLFATRPDALWLAHEISSQTR